MSRIIGAVFGCFFFVLIAVVVLAFVFLAN